MYSKAKRAVIARPSNATPEFCQATEVRLITHYSTILTPELMIAHRSGCYATIINSTVDNTALDILIGTAYAKEMTEAVLNNISAQFSAVPQS